MSAPTIEFKTLKVPIAWISGRSLYGELANQQRFAGSRPGIRVD